MLRLRWTRLWCGLGESEESPPQSSAASTRPQRGLNWILSTVQCDDLHGEVSSQLYLSPLIPLNTSAGTNKATLTLELGLSTLWCKPQLGVMSRTQQAGNGYGQSRKYVFFCRRQFTINHLAHFLETQGIMKNNKKRFELWHAEIDIKRFLCSSLTFYYSSYH